MKQKKHLAQAVKIAGGQTALARKLAEVTGHPYKQGHVWGWLKDKPLPAEAVIPIERIVDGKVSRHDLRPDIYPVEAA